MSTKQLAESPKVTMLRDMLMASKGAIAAVLPQHLTVDRQLRLALMTAGNNKALLECTPVSILQCVVTASQLGLEPGGPLGHAYLVPYKDTATFIIGYRGLVELVLRTGKVSSFSAHVVYERDTFSVELGTVGCITHRPYTGADDPGQMIAVYAVAKFNDGSTQFDVMTKAQVDLVRKRSRASASGPWVTDYAEMAKKTVARRLCKYLPMSVTVAEALDTDRPREMDPDFSKTIEAERMREPKPKHAPAPAETAEAAQTATQAPVEQTAAPAGESWSAKATAGYIADIEASPDVAALEGVSVGIKQDGMKFAAEDLSRLQTVYAKKMRALKAS